MKSITHDNWANHGVILLNASYEELMVISAARAVALVIQRDSKDRPVVSVIQSNASGFMVRSPSLSIPLPDVLLLSKYVYIEHKVEVHEHSIATTTGVLRRDKYTCVYCGGSGFTVDHIIPVSRGGQSTWQNTACACGPCNWTKADRTPTEARMRLRWEPYVPNFEKVQLRQLTRGHRNSTRPARIHH